jgi:chromosome segregation ATPase
MLVSISKAHQLTGVARSTIYKDIDEGRLSYTTDARDRKQIMVSELQRVYGDFDIASLDKKPNSNVQPSVVTVSDRSEEGTSQQNASVAVLQERIKSAQLLLEQHKQSIEELKQERGARERTHEEAIEHERELNAKLLKSLQEAQESNKTFQKLLEDQRPSQDGVGEWDKQFKALEARLANREKEDKERREREEKILSENNRLKEIAKRQKRALEAEKNKNLWQKLFG